MSIELFTHDSVELRTVVIDGDPWFVAADVGLLLEYSATSALTRRLDAEDKGVRDLHTLGGAQNMTVISEAGFYAAILGSQSEKAKAVKRWLTHEVLPTLRKTGTYSTAPALTDDELIHQALSISATRVAALTERVAELEPKAEYVDIFVAGSDVMSFRTVASTLDISEGWLRRELIDRKWIYVEETSRWSNSKGCKIPVRRYSERSDKKAYFQRCETHEAPRFRGEVMHTLKITAEGAQAISRMVPRWMKENAA